MLCVLFFSLFYRCKISSSKIIWWFYRFSALLCPNVPFFFFLSSFSYCCFSLCNSSSSSLSLCPSYLPSFSWCFLKPSSSSRVFCFPHRFAAIQACEQQLLQFRGLSGSLLRWLQTAQEQLPSKEANLTTEALQRRVQQLKVCVYPNPASSGLTWTKG